MSKASLPPRPLAPMRRPPVRPLAPQQVEALTIAMIVAPGVYARNRMFDLFTSPCARRARHRASILRGVVVQLAKAEAVTLSTAEAGVVLRYAIPALRLSRVLVLSDAELSALRVAAERANVRALPREPVDRERVARSLATLMEGAHGDELKDALGIRPAE